MWFKKVLDGNFVSEKQLWRLLNFFSFPFLSSSFVKGPTVRFWEEILSATNLSSSALKQGNLNKIYWKYVSTKVIYLIKQKNTGWKIGKKAFINYIIIQCCKPNHFLTNRPIYGTSSKTLKLMATQIQFPGPKANVLSHKETLHKLNAKKSRHMDQQLLFLHGSICQQQ